MQKLLTVDSRRRPDCTELLMMPCLLKRMNENHLQEIDDDELNQEMLNTITIPKNLKFLSKTLPKPNYAPLRLRMIDRSNFLKTLYNVEDNGSLLSIDDFKSHSLPRIK